MNATLNKVLIISGVIFVLVLCYFLFFRDAVDKLMPQTNTSEDPSARSAVLLKKIRELDKINVESHANKVFSDPLFRSLTDLRTDLGAEAYGRPNPFLPVR